MSDPFSNSTDNLRSIINLSQGPAQPCHYVINIVPKLDFLEGIGALFSSSVSVDTAIALPIINLLAMRRLSILAESVSIPSRTLSTTSLQMFGTKREMPYGVLFDTMTITFICTNWMVERTFFDLWHQFIIAPKTNYLGYYDDYVSNIVITKTDNSNSVDAIAGAAISTFILEEAYPKTILSQELAYDSTNEYLRLSVEFSYARFRTTLNFLDSSNFSEIPIPTLPKNPVTS